MWVEAFAPAGADESLAMAFARRARTGVFMILMPSAAKTASKDDVNRESGHR